MTNHFFSKFEDHVSQAQIKIPESYLLEIDNASIRHIIVSECL